MRLAARFMRFMSRSGWLSDARLLELYPPFIPMRIEVMEIGAACRTYNVLVSEERKVLVAVLLP